MHYSGLGQHSSAVREAVEFFAERGPLHKPLTEGNLAESIVLVDKLTSLDRFRDPDHVDAEIKGDTNWVDILRTDEHLSPSSWIGDHEHREYRLFVAIRTAVWPQIETLSELALTADEASEVCEFAFELAYQRMVSGVLPSVHERLFSVYRAGGYPCGWVGTFPSGRFAVFAG